MFSAQYKHKSWLKCTFHLHALYLFLAVTSFVCGEQDVTLRWFMFQSILVAEGHDVTATLQPNHHSCANIALSAIDSQRSCRPCHWHEHCSSSRKQWARGDPWEGRTPAQQVLRLPPPRHWEAGGNHPWELWEIETSVSSMFLFLFVLPCVSCLFMDIHWGTWELWVRDEWCVFALSQLLSSNLLCSFLHVMPRLSRLINYKVFSWQHIHI